MGSISTCEAFNREWLWPLRSLDGPFELTFRDDRLGRESRDMGLFKDDDGKGYLLTEDVCASFFATSLNIPPGG